ncbi:MAG: hypothetical protein K5866_01835 [Treponema sp.]|nr:hypothetical protein [Treponema sp.]
METIIKTYSQLLEYYSKVKNKTVFENIHFDVSELEIIHIHVEGIGFNSACDVYCMKAFEYLQSEIYREYALLAYGVRNASKLKQEEKYALQFFVKIEKGSTIFSILLPEAVGVGLNILSDVTGNEFFRNYVLIACAKVLSGVVGYAIDNKISGNSLPKKKMEINSLEMTSQDISFNFWNFFKSNKHIEKITTYTESVNK